MGVATPVQLTDDERVTLETWVRRTTTEQRMVQRARIVLEAAAGKMTKEVAALLQVRPATVSGWRTRFAEHRVAGLADAPRPGKPAKYDETTVRRILPRRAPNGASTGTRFVCPRCNASFWINYDELECLHCGYVDYEYTPSTNGNGNGKKSVP